jgi:outer membrane protein W
MRTLTAVVFSLLVATSAFAQKKNEFSIFVSDANVSYSRDQGTRGSGSPGLAFDRMVTPRISAQIAVAYERHHTYSYIVNPNGTFTQVPPLPFTTYPIDLSARYHFLNDTRWKPYLGLGLRYVRQPHISYQFRYRDHVGPEIVGGTAFQLTKSFGLVLDGKAYLGDREQYDSQLKSSFGLFWRF